MANTQADANSFVRDGLAALRAVDPDQTYALETFGPRAVIDAIDDVALLPHLAAILERTHNDAVRKVVAHLLGRLWRNSRDRAVSDYLMSRILVDPRVKRAEPLLWSLTGVPVPDVERIGPLLAMRKALRNSILTVLSSCPNAACEDEVIHVLENTRSKYERALAAQVLGTIGSTKSIPYLEKYLVAASYDVACAACAAISRIVGGSDLAYLVSLLEKPNVPGKNILVRAIIRNYGTEAVPTIISRTKRLTSGKRVSISPPHDNQLMEAVEFLEHHASGRQELLNLYRLIKNRWKKLPADEREFLVGRVPFFADMSWNVRNRPPFLYAPSQDNVEEARALLLLRRRRGTLTFDDRDPARPLISISLFADGPATEVVEALRLFPDLQELSLGTSVQDVDLKVIGAATRLKHLCLTDARAITDAGILHLSWLRRLEALHFVGARITDASVEWIVDQSQLTRLFLEGSAMSEDGCRRLLRITQLRELTIGKTDAGDFGLVGLEGLHRLWILRLCGTRITDDTLARCAMLKGLSLLDLRDTKITDEGLEYLVSIRSLRSVFLAGTQVSGAGAERLRAAISGISVDLHTKLA